jgi:hypothetical protein
MLTIVDPAFHGSGCLVLAWLWYTAGVERLMLAFPVLMLTGPVVLEALRSVGKHMLSYYDA